MSKKPDIKADILAVKDRGETKGLVEPLLIAETSRHRGALTDLALELASKAAGSAKPAGKSADFARRFPTGAKRLLQQPHRHARRMVSALADRGVLTADGSRAPLRLVFPARLVSRVVICVQQDTTEFWG